MVKLITNKLLIGKSFVSSTPKQLVLSKQFIKQKRSHIRKLIVRINLQHG